MSKKSFVIFSIFLGLFFLLMVSCKSGAETKKDDVPATVEEDSNVNSAENKARNAIQKAEKLMNECKARNVDSSYEKEFKLAMEDLDMAKQNNDVKKYGKSNKFADSAFIKFQTLIHLDDANKLKSEIMENAFEGFNADDYSAAEIAYIKAFESFGDENALSYAKTSEELYMNVLDAGYAEWIGIARNNAEEAKVRCDGIRANKGASKEYGAAYNVFKKASVDESKKSMKAAYDGYNDSAEKFNVVYDLVLVKRAEAEKAIQAAKEKQKISSDLAKEADIEAPLPDEVVESDVSDVEVE